MTTEPLRDVEVMMRTLHEAKVGCGPIGFVPKGGCAFQVHRAQAERLLEAAPRSPETPQWLMPATQGPKPGADEWGRPLYVITGDVPHLLAQAIPLAASPETSEAGIDVERLAEMHWWLVTEVNSTDERFLELLDWLEPLIPDDVADRMDARLASRGETR